MGILTSSGERVKSADVCMEYRMFCIDAPQSNQDSSVYNMGALSIRQHLFS